MNSYECEHGTPNPGILLSRTLGLQNLKGISTPMELYQVLGESGEQNRFAATITTA